MRKKPVFQRATRHQLLKLTALVTPASLEALARAEARFLIAFLTLPPRLANVKERFALFDAYELVDPGHRHALVEGLIALDEGAAHAPEASGTRVPAIVTEQKPTKRKRKPTSIWAGNRGPFRLIH